MGSGFIALDFIFDGKDSKRPSRVFAGGSCGNVLTILPLLGWESHAAARLKEDRFGESIIKDFKRCKVDTELLLREANGVTPVVIQRNLSQSEEKKGSGKGFKFEWRCPISGTRLPMYRPQPIRFVEEIIDRIPTAAVFYFDRAEKSLLMMAEELRRRGALIVFEPVSFKEDPVARKCLEVAHIVKYADDRIEKSPFIKRRKRPFLEIQTMGEAGLRYRISKPGVAYTWRSSPAKSLVRFVDSCGAGDWCTAGIIAQIGKLGAEGLKKLRVSEIVKAIKAGQALSAINCEFPGARGGLYRSERPKMLRRIEAVS